MLRLTLLCAVIIGTSGCVSTRTPTTVDSSCTSYQIIRPSRADTLDTKRQVLAHNTIHRKLCGGK